MPSIITLKKNLFLTTIAATARAQSIGNYSTISNTTSSACPAPGTAHVIVARASTEPLGYGIIGAVKDLVIEALPGSNAEYVVYPATLTDYFDSEGAGVLGMKALIEAYLAKNCAEPLVLMGYSQGAHVTADFLSGQSVNGFPFNASLTEPASEEVFRNLAAVTIMGDPSINITDNAFHVGNSTRSGLFARFANSSSVLNGIESNIQSYCDALDPYCASAGNFDNISVHTGYVQEYGRDAADFVVQKIKDWHGNNETSGSGNGTAGTPTQTGSPAEYIGSAATVGGGIAGVIAVALAFGTALLVGL